MELKTYIDVIWRRKWVFAAVALVVIGATILVNAQMPVAYMATARLRVMTPVEGSSSYIDHNIYYANRLMNTYISMASSSLITNELVKKMDLKESPEISANMIADSELIEVSVEQPTAEEAALATNTLAETLIEYSRGAVEKPEIPAKSIYIERLVSAQEEISEAEERYEALIQPASQAAAMAASLNQSIQVNQDLYEWLKEQYEQAKVAEFGLPTTVAAAASRARSTETLGYLTERLIEVEKELGEERVEYTTISAQAAETGERLSAARQWLQIKEQEYATLLAQSSQIEALEYIGASSDILVLVDPATAPEAPSTANKTLILLVGIAAGLLLASLGAFLADNLVRAYPKLGNFATGQRSQSSAD